MSPYLKGRRISLLHNRTKIKSVYLFFIIIIIFFFFFFGGGGSDQIQKTIGKTWMSSDCYRPHCGRLSFHKTTIIIFKILLCCSFWTYLREKMRFFSHMVEKSLKLVLLCFFTDSEDDLNSFLDNLWWIKKKFF